MQKKNVFTTLVILLALLAVAGCSPSQKRGSGSVLANSEMINIHQLAGRLNMAVDSIGKNKVTFSNSTDSVTLYRDVDLIYLNNDYIGPLGKTKKIDGMLCVRPDIEDEIRSRLKKYEPVLVTPTLEPVIIEKTRDCTIVIDPGHGGKDPGATSLHGFYEKVVNFDVAMQLTEMLRDDDFDIITTRDRDIFIELEERAAIANRNNADLFVSIHADSSATSTTNGFTLYVSRSATAESIALAQAIDKQMARTGIKSRGVRKADFRVLTHTRCPAVLVELGYLSNYWEAKQLKDKNMQNRLAGAITGGITDYCQRISR